MHLLSDGQFRIKISRSIGPFISLLMKYNILYILCYIVVFVSFQTAIYTVKGVMTIKLLFTQMISVVFCMIYHFRQVCTAM